MNGVFFPSVSATYDTVLNNLHTLDPTFDSSTVAFAISPAMEVCSTRSRRPFFVPGAVYQLPVEILRMIFRHIPRLSMDHTGAVAPWFASYSHVCRHWYNVAVSTPELWCQIPKGLSAPWIMAHFERSQAQPLYIHVVAFFFHESGIFDSLCFNMHRVRELSLDVSNFHGKFWRDHVILFLRLRAPELQRFEIMDLPNAPNEYMWLDKGLFGGQTPNLHTLRFGRGFDIMSDYHFLRYVRHLHFDAISYHQYILVVLRHSPLLESLSFEMNQKSDEPDDVEDIMETLEPQLPIVLPHLTFLSIPYCLINDFARIFQDISAPSGPRWRIDFAVGMLEQGGQVWLYALDTLAGYIHQRRAVGDAVADLYIDLDYRRCAMRGWPSGVLPPNWHLDRSPPSRNPDSSMFDFGLKYNGKEDADENSIDEFDSSSLDEIVLVAERLPLSDVQTAWISAIELIYDITSRATPSWTSLLRQLPNLHALTLSHSVTFGVLTAFVEEL